MYLLDKIKIRPKLVVTYTLVGLVPLLTVAWLCLNSGSTALMESAFSQLQAVQKIKQDHIKQYFDDRLLLMKDVQNDIRFSEGIKKFSQAYESGVDSDEYKSLVTQMTDSFKSFQKTFGFYDIFLINAKGDVVYTLAKESDFRTNLVSGKWSESGLASLYNKCKKGISFVDYSWYEPSNEPASFIGTPITHEGKLLGVAGFQISLKEINKIMLERTGMGDTGETYLVGPDNKMRSDSYLEPQKHSVHASFLGTVEANGVNTKATERALVGKTGIDVIIDYNGNKVLSAYSPMELPDTKWAVIAEIDLAEVQEPIYTLNSTTFLIVIVTAMAVVIHALLISASISKPIVAISNIAQEISKGNYNNKIDIKQNDEIGFLANSFLSMQKSLQDKDQMEKQLVQTERLASLGTLVAGIAHEINNPNGLILLNMPLLKRIWKDCTIILDQHLKNNEDFLIGGLDYTSAKHQIADMLNESEEASKRIARIVSDLKSYGRKDQEENLSPIDINSVVKSSIRLVSNQLKKSTENFKVELQDNLPQTKGSYQQIEQVVVNLLMNASQSLNDKKQSIFLNTMYNGKEIEVCVMDQGKGIPVSDMKHICDPFFTTKRDIGGTGLGLSVSMNIVERHNAQLIFDSEPGKGTKVRLILPVI